MKKLFAILIMCLLTLPVFSIEGQESELAPVSAETVETVQEDSPATEAPVINEELKPVPVQMPTKYKEPIGKKKLAKKFIIAMLCVIGTSVFLYGSLTLYNKFRDGFFSNAPLPPEGEKPLDKPDDLTEAIKTFIDKTHWEN